VARLILDTGVLVSVERGRLDLAAVVGADDDITIPVVAVAELVAGVHLADTDAGRATRRAFLDGILQVVPTDEYTAEVGEHHGLLLAHTRRLGQPKGAHDLIIAATARATGRTILTTDKGARYDHLPGVSMLVVTASV
jgi:tRNA(fMet)-specific endonuclease VapC